MITLIWFNRNYCSFSIFIFTSSSYNTIYAIQHYIIYINSRFCFQIQIRINLYSTCLIQIAIRPSNKIVSLIQNYRYFNLCTMLILTRTKDYCIFCYQYQVININCKFSIQCYIRSNYHFTCNFLYSIRPTYKMITLFRYCNQFHFSSISITTTTYNISIFACQNYIIHIYCKFSY